MNARPSNETVIQIDLTALDEDKAEMFLESLYELTDHEEMEGLIGVEELEPDYEVAEDGRLSKPIRAYGQPLLLGCDGKCNKAWGINNRPRNHFVPESDDPDDYEYLADQELGEAPANPGTYEGGEGKPGHFLDKLNKWCFRECERGTTVDAPGTLDDLELPDFSKRQPNRRDREASPAGSEVQT